MSQGKSVPIVNIQDGNISINTVIIDSILDQVGDREFALISINGNTRTGKSFMLTKFLSYLNAKENLTKRSESWLEDYDEKSFDWRGGSSSQTKGINMWSKPILTTVKGREIAILLMDTQGNFDDNSTLDQNAKIFAITSLFSSVLIFNTMRDIGENVLQFFQLFSGFTEVINGHQGETRDAKLSQKLIFLLRDVELAEYQYGYYDDNICPVGQLKNLKKEKLAVKDSQPPEVRKVRKDIASTFKDIGLFTLPHPGKELARYDRQDKLDPEFKLHMKEFVEFVFSPRNLKLKHFGGIAVTGKEFKKYVRSWDRVFAGNGLPNVSTVYDTAAEMQNRIALGKGMSEYEKQMHDELSRSDNRENVTDETFEELHLVASKAAIKTFKKERRLGGDEYKMQFLQNLKEEIQAKKSDYISINLAKRKREAEKRIQEAKIKQLAKERRELDRRNAAKRAEAAARRAEEAELQRKVEEARKQQEEQQRHLEWLRIVQENERRQIEQQIQNARNSPPDDCHIL